MAHARARVKGTPRRGADLTLPTEVPFGQTGLEKGRKILRSAARLLGRHRQLWFLFVFRKFRGLALLEKRIDPLSARPHREAIAARNYRFNLATRSPARTTVAGSAKAGRQYRKNDAESNLTKIAWVPGGRPARTNENRFPRREPRASRSHPRERKQRGIL